MKKLHIQKSIAWCEKHDISSVKLFSSNNIFLSTTYDDGTPISFLKNNNNNAFLKNKSSNFTNGVYVCGSSAYNVNNVNNINKLNSPIESENSINDVMSPEVVILNTHDTSNS
jgi:hypothetical protein